MIEDDAYNVSARARRVTVACRRSFPFSHLRVCLPDPLHSRYLALHAMPTKQDLLEQATKASPAQAEAIFKEIISLHPRSLLHTSGG